LGGVKACTAGTVPVTTNEIASKYRAKRAENLQKVVSKSLDIKIRKKLQKPIDK